jgi:hypothetical protein
MFMRCLVAFFIMVVLVLAVASCGDSAGYRQFGNRDQKYYAELADSCRTLMKITGAPATFSGEASKLPVAIRELNPISVEVSTNRVFIMMGKGRARYEIIWEQSDNEQPVWELSTNAEGLCKVLFREKGLNLTGQP